MVALSNNSSQQTPEPAGSYPGAPGLRDLPYRAAALTNSSASIVEAYDCDAYGNTLIFTGPGADGVWFTDDDVQSNYGANSIIYCGYRYDSETQNYYVRNRTYNPVLGRWLQRDPIGHSGGINLYGYVASRPTVIPDRYGLAWWWPFGGPSVPKPTGNPSADAGTYIDMIKEREFDAAKEFMKEAAKRYANAGLEEALDRDIQDLRGTPGLDAAMQRAISTAADDLTADALERLSAVAGFALGDLIGALKGLSAGCCVKLLQTIENALQGASRGDPCACAVLDEPDNNLDCCQNAIYTKGGSQMDFLHHEVERVHTGCLRLAQRAAQPISKNAKPRPGGRNSNIFKGVL